MAKIFVKENMVGGKCLFSISNSRFSDQHNDPIRTSRKSNLLSLVIPGLLIISLSGSRVFSFNLPESQSISFLSYQVSNQVSNRGSKNKWAGEYLFEDIAGWRERGPGGAVPSISYSITVSERKGKLFAKLEVDGFQISDSYACTAEADGNWLNLYYLSGGGGFDKTNSRGFKKGQILLSLTKTVSGKRIRYGFEPGSYEIFLFGNKKRKIYFSKL